MAATCAACLEPILKRRDQFVIAGTEVFHRACIADIAQSRSTLLQLKNIELRQRVADLQARLQTREDRSDHEATVRDLRASLSSSVHAERQTRDRAAIDLDRANLARVQAERALAEATRERDQAVRELALHRALDGARTQAQVAPAPPAPPVTPVSVPDPAGLDDAEQRFRLLELDPLE